MIFFYNLAWFFQANAARYCMIVIAIIAASIISLLPPLWVARVIDGISTQHSSTDELLSQLGIIAGLALLTYCLRFLWRNWLFGTALKLEKQLVLNLYRDFCQQKPGFYRQHPTGKLLTLLGSDVAAVSQGAGNGVVFLIDALVMTTLVLIILVTNISLSLTVFALLPLPLMALLIRRYGKQMQSKAHRQQQALAELNQQVQQTFSGIEVIKSYSSEKQSYQDFVAQLDKLTQENIELAEVEAKYEPTTGLVSGLCFLFSMAGGSWLIYQGQLSLGQLMAFNMYLGYLIWPVNALGWLFNLLALANVSHQRIQDMMSPDQNPPAPTRQAARTSPDLTVSIDRFTYPGESTPCLRQVSFQLKPGQTLGLVGKTGSGKSTILKLLLGAYPVPESSITLNNLSIDEWDDASVNHLFSYVPQQPVLFSGTIAENISLETSANQQLMQHVAKLACIHQEIMALPQGYQTQLKEQGAGLSGGQQQRIAIARALYKNAPCLLLDDASSALDQTTEIKLLNNLRSWAGSDKSLLIVSHRLNSLNLVDQVLLMESGSLTQQGSHHTLIERAPWYAKMVKHQQTQLAEPV